MIGLRTAVVGAVVSLWLAGCSFSIGGGGIDVDSLEEQIAAKINTIAPGEEAAVDCPDDVASAAGTTFQCTATIAGQPVTYKVTLTDDQGTFDAQPEQAVLDLKKAQDEIAAGLTKQVPGSWQVDCAQPGRAAILVAKPGDTFPCSFGGQSDDGQSVDAGQVEVTVTDAQGGINWEVAR